MMHSTMSHQYITTPRLDLYFISAITAIPHIHGQESTITQEQVTFIAIHMYVMVADILIWFGRNFLARVLIATSLGASIPTP